MKLSKVTDHVYWLPPGKPDRPSLVAVAGTSHTLLVDAGASVAHITLFLDALKAAGVSAPSYAVLTHWHWDHVFGSEALGTPIITHRETAKKLQVLAGYDWTNAALEHRLTTGEEVARCVADIKQELPEPRSVRIILPDIVFDDSLEIRLGGITCYIQHVGGDHASDSTIVHVSPDRVLILGDCLYDAIYTPARHYTRANLLPLVDKILQFEADHFIEGHNPGIMSRTELETMVHKMRFAASLADEFGTDETGALAQISAPDEDTEYFVRALIAGNRLRSLDV